MMVRMSIINWIFRFRWQRKLSKHHRRNTKKIDRLTSYRNFQAVVTNSPQRAGEIWSWKQKNMSCNGKEIVASILSCVGVCWSFVSNSLRLPKSDKLWESPFSVKKILIETFAAELKNVIFNNFVFQCRD